MAVGFLDLVRVSIPTTGTGSTLTIGAALAGWLTFSNAGGVNGTIYSYTILDGNNTEVGTIVYNSGTQTLSGRTVSKSTNSNAAISLTGNAILAVSLRAEDTFATLGTNALALNGAAVGTVAAPLSTLVWGNDQSIQWVNASGLFNGSTQGAALFKHSDNNIYFDNFDGGATFFRGNSLAHLLTVSPTGVVTTNTLSAPYHLTAITPGFGYSTMAQGDGSVTGYFEWWNPAGTRTAYMGADSLALVTLALNAVDFAVTGGRVGIGIAPSQKLSVLSADNVAATNIAAFYANNTTQAIGIGYQHIRQISAGVPINLDAGTSGVVDIGGISTGGVFLATAGGNVGVGTAAPAYNLDVAADARARMFVVGGGGGAYGPGAIYSDSNYGMILRAAVAGVIQAFLVTNAAGSPLLSITNAGATIIPGVTTHVGTNVGSFASPLLTNTNIILYDGGATNWSGIGADAGGSMYFVTGSGTPASRLVISPSGTASFVSAADGMYIDFPTSTYGLKFLRSTVVLGDIYKNTGVPMVFDSPAAAGTLAGFLFNAPGAGVTTAAAVTVSTNVTGPQPGFPGGSSTVIAQFAAVDGNSARIFLDSYGAAPTYSLRRAQGTAGSGYTTVTSGINLGQLDWFGYDGTWQTTPNASVKLVATQNWSAGNHGNYLSFSTTPTNTGSFVEAVRFYQGVCIGPTFSDPGSGNLIVNGTVSIAINTALQQWFNVNSGATGGTSGAAAVTLGQIGVSEGVTLTAGGATLDGMAYTHNVIGGTGLRQSWQMGTFLTADAGSGGWNAATNGGFVSSLVINTVAGHVVSGVFTGVNAGGSSGTKAGQLFCFNPELLFPTGATFYLEGSAAELNVAVQTGASVSYVSGIKVIHNAAHAVAGGVQDCAYVLTDTVGITQGWKVGFFVGTFGGSSAAQTPMDPAGTIFQADASVNCFRGIDLSAAAFTGAGNAAFKSPGFSVDNVANMVCQGATQAFGQASNALTNFAINGANSGTAGGVAVGIQNNSVLIGKFGNYSAVNNTAYNGDMAVAGLNSSALWLQSAANTWVYLQPANTGNHNPVHITGLSVGWNQSGGGQETNFANRNNNAGAWDFIFQDWDGTTLTNLAYINKGGGLYIPSTVMQTTAGGNMFPTPSGTWGQIGGSLPSSNGNTAGVADTFFAVGFGCSDSAIRAVPYNATTGVWLGANAEQCTLFVGNTQPGTGDPTPQGCTLAGIFVAGKQNAPSGASQFGQTGGLWINAIGGWNGALADNCKFTVSCTVTNGSPTITVPAAPTNYRYFVGMAVTGASLATSTSVRQMSGSTLTLTNNWTGTSGAVSLTFAVGTPVTAPVTTFPPTATSPSGSTNYNPLSGTPGDVFGFNFGIEIYDNGIGIAELFEGSIKHLVPGAGAANISIKLSAGLVTGSPTGINLSGSYGAAAVGFGVQPEILGVHTPWVCYFGGNIAGGGGTVDGQYYLLDASGNYLSHGMVAGVISSPQLKRDIRKIEDVKSRIMQVDPVFFWFLPEVDTEGYQQAGFLATDHEGMRGLRGAFDGFHDGLMTPVHTPLGRHDGYHPSHMLPFLWRGVQELWAETENLLDRMNGLEARVERLEGMAAH